MIAWIELLDRWLQKHYRRCYKKLLPGVTDEQLNGLEAMVGHALPPSFRDFYRWHNGQSYRNYGRPFYYGYIIIPVEEIVGEWELMRSLLGDFPYDDWWKADWLPFLTDQSGNLICIDFGGAYGGVRGQVLVFYHDDTFRHILSPSFEAWGESFVASLERGHWRSMPCRTFLPTDDYTDLVGAMYPGYPWHTDVGARPEPPAEPDEWELSI